MKPWSEREDNAIRAGRSGDQPVSFRELSMRTGRTEGAVTARWHRLQELAGHVFEDKSGLRRVKPGLVPEAVSADCRARALLREERELAGETTAMFCGDPLPGYSALDRPGISEPVAAGYAHRVTLATKG